MSWKGRNTVGVIQDLFGINTNTVMLAATGQHVGKTTLSLGVFGSLEQKWGKGRVAYCKPLGQKYTDVVCNGKTLKVDNDVHVMRNYFKLQDSWEHMSPVVFPPGYTRSHIDAPDRSQKTGELLTKIKDSFTHLATKSDFVLLEGSGHMGVGSIVNLNNAQVAGALGADVVIIAPGGLGSSFDTLALNKALIEKHGARLRGVILNKVQEDKCEMVEDYYSRQLEYLWGKPLLGCIPLKEAISRPTITGFAELLGADWLAGESERHRTFETTRVVLTQAAADSVVEVSAHNQLIITNVECEDVIEAVCQKHKALLESSLGTEHLRGGLIVAGTSELRKDLRQELDLLGIPTVWVHRDGEAAKRGTTFEILKMINSYTQKHSSEDTGRVEDTMDHIRQHIDFEGLCQEIPLSTRVKRAAVRGSVDTLLGRWRTWR
ncbi:AAA domain-containing protein [Baffinella frigidus]|nr:AAA domain-containing protein [Cryptophyta sp. CCMP2293]|mmetsp:Transcript_36230/g.85735  ORF Transcript_36230/g.85735 Transcript_36230/m.85735 type:complete len:433 (-) Transcript_36230:282-1580(-)